MAYSVYHASCRRIECWYLLTCYVQMAVVLKTGRSTTCIAGSRLLNYESETQICAVFYCRIIGYSSWRRVNAAEYFILVGHTTQQCVRLVKGNSDWFKIWQTAVFDQSEAGDEIPAFLRWTAVPCGEASASRHDFYSLSSFVYVKILQPE